MYCVYVVTQMRNPVTSLRVQPKPLYNIRLKCGLLVHFAFNNKKKTKIKISKIKKYMAKTKQ